MFVSLKAIISTTIATLAVIGVVSGQNITIVSPQSGQVIRAGDVLTVELAQQSTTSSVQNIAFSTGFSSRPTDTISLGRPLGGTQFLTTRGNITFQINVPKASEFIDGISNVPYEFKVAHYYFLGATSTPTIDIASVPVSVQQ
ncbi:hypothetical protein BY996DRAFT_6414459 [Phakopsora pachyrhizi]|uniref:Expressed protein n=1 Tax=Phakopsora pachyrhizi TaxID=170000 RepID=A0A0S1MKJ0_PHAPC|nr:hypothetical protein BY996DRAFT_6414459 [Phakopsora pachyrhizi]CAH7669517.1 expressed protein [Phakopsora pachyrhizi]